MVSRRFYELFFAILTLVALVVTSTNIYSQVTAAPAAITNPTIALVGFINAWNSTSATPNPTITVTQGDTLTIQLSSGDGAPHRFFVDVDNNGPTPDCPGADVCSNQFPPSTTLTFTVNFAPGNYTYYCSIHPTTMLGKFVVLKPPPGPAGGRHQLAM